MFHSNILFQSTYLYKVRPNRPFARSVPLCFNPRTYIRYDCTTVFCANLSGCFNPRTYIRYDEFTVYHVRKQGFNPRTYIRYDLRLMSHATIKNMFQSTYLYKVRHKQRILYSFNDSFNPRTYIRYDCITNNANIYSLLSMHLCDNKLFGFFIDEIKLIGVFNRLIINDCENSSFLLMLNVRKQLYYKFIFYIIGCDDTYVFNSFRIIISQEIETNTIFFMIDDIR